MFRIVSIGLLAVLLMQYLSHFLISSYTLFIPEFVEIMKSLVSS